MTPKIIELKQAPIVLVEKPNEDDNDIVIVSGKEIFYNGDYFELPKADFYNPWGALGILSDLTEDQFAECVPKEMYSHITNPKAIWYEVYFYSLLESENVCTENPYQKPTLSPITSEDSDDFLFPTESGTEKWAEYENQFLTWKQAQSRTIDPTRTVVLLRK